MGETLHIYPTRLRIEEELSKSDFVEGVVFTDSMMSFGEFEEKLADELVRLKPVEETTRWLFLHDSAVSASAGHPQISALAEAAGFKNWVCGMMSDAYRLNVPIKVDAGAGKKWSEAH
jgi:hypothetical protein